MTTTQTTEPIYQVSQVKIHYGHANDVTGVEEVPASQLYRELEARGVQRRLFTYEDGTSQTVNGEFTQWKLVRRGGAAGQRTPAPLQVPARELAVGDVITELTALADAWDKLIESKRLILATAQAEGNAVQGHRVDASLTSLQTCASEVRDLLARLQA